REMQVRRRASRHRRTGRRDQRPCERHGPQPERERDRRQNGGRPEQDGAGIMRRGDLAGATLAEMLRHGI
ncbi:hypothetical protein LTR94_035674, partial [Friedmanniomyces endolithicus]